MVIYNGLDQTIEELNNYLNTVSLISGLFITISIDLIFNPSEKLLLPENSKLKDSFFAFVTVSILCKVLTILYHSSLTMNLSRAARDSDKIRLFIRFHWIP